METKRESFDTNLNKDNPQYIFCEMFNFSLKKIILKSLKIQPFPVAPINLLRRKCLIRPLIILCLKFFI